MCVIEERYVSINFMFEMCLECFAYEFVVVGPNVTSSVSYIIVNTRSNVTKSGVGGKNFMLE